VINPSQVIKDYNKDRNQQLLQRKYERMNESIWSFFRGTCHLFYQEIQNDKFLSKSPSVWICGDLHLENFGAHKGNNRLVYFDLNDFDEAIQGPLFWELSRVLISIMIAGESWNLNKTDRKNLCKYFLDYYTKALKVGNAQLLERELAQGIICDLLTQLEKRKRRDLLINRVQEKKGKLKLILNKDRALPLEDDYKQEVIDHLQKWVNEKQYFGKILDVATRIAGTGSLGIERYIILAENCEKNKNPILLDMKKAEDSCLKPFLGKQPIWENNAQRTIGIQKMMQAVPPAFLDITNIDDRFFVLKELQPVEDKIKFDSLAKNFTKITQVIEDLASLTAWAQLRSGGRKGSAITDELIDFANQDWQDDLLKFCDTMIDNIKNDYNTYCTSFNEGFFQM